MIFRVQEWKISVPISIIFDPGDQAARPILQLIARRVGRIQKHGNLHSAASGRRATRGDGWECFVGSTDRKLLGSVS